MIIHNLKINREFADAVSEGRKTFEIRKNDRGFKVGHKVTFSAIENLEFIKHPINDQIYEITYILTDPYIAEGHVALAIKRVGRC